jgi:hypothetical protein
MKKLILLLITLTTLKTVSYASFPVSDTLKVKQDILQKEEIKQYHSNLIKMGVDLNDCRCESCRDSIPKKLIDYHKIIFKFFLLTGCVGLIMMLYGILSPHPFDIFVTLYGSYIFIPSVLALLINFLIKRKKVI